MEIGSSRLQRCAFITLTYKRGSQRLLDAGRVQTDWRRFWFLLRRDQPDLGKLKWLRVMELTKAGTPHHHLIVGQLPKTQQIRCWGEHFDARAYKARLQDCTCLAHRFGRTWYAVTTDSWIAHATRVKSAAGAAGYLGKYLLKTMYDRRNYPMKRRWSSSRGWPGTGRVRLKQTETLAGWYKMEFHPGTLIAEEGGPADLLERVGDSMTMARNLKRQQMGSLSQLERMVNSGSDDREKAQPKADPHQHR